MKKYVDIRYRFLAVLLVLFTLISSYSISPTAYALPSQQDTVCANTAVEALYIFDGEQDMVSQIIESQDGSYAKYEKNVDAWATAYDILPEEIDPDAEMTYSDFAEILWNYAKHHDADLTEYEDNGEHDAVGWANEAGIVPDWFDDEDEAVTVDGLNQTLDRLAETHFDVVGVVSDGLSLLYPSEGLTTINPLCDFYVIGDIDKSVSVPDDAELLIQLINSDGQVAREVFTDIKDNWAGMNVDYPELMLFTNKEDFRKSMMPDLVYDPSDPSSFGNVWIKACYSDDHYTGVIYGGGYHQDINPVDQNGEPLEAIPEGDYSLQVTLKSEEETLASLSTQITIGIVPRKVLSRFSPSSYFDKMKGYADEQGYTIYSDPFPGNWNTQSNMPEWNENYRGYINDRWRLADRLGYVGGMTYFFDYNISSTSTSYTVELGQLGYDKALEDNDSITYVYLDIGEPEIHQQGKVYEGKFVQLPLDKMEPVLFTRADHSDISTPENVINPTILNETTSEFDLFERFVANPGETVSLNGICQVIQPENVILNDNETFTMGNRISSIRYVLRYATGDIYAVVEKPVSGLERTFANGDTSTSILEFRHNFAVTEDMRGNDIRIFAQALDESGNAVGTYYYACMFRVPRI